MSLPDHIEGFLELLDACGAQLFFGGDSFRAVVKTLEPKAREFDLTPGDDNSVQVSLLAADAPEGLARVGESFTGPDASAYRITRVRPAGATGVLRLECVGASL